MEAERKQQLQRRATAHSQSVLRYVSLFNVFEKAFYLRALASRLDALAQQAEKDTDGESEQEAKRPPGEPAPHVCRQSTAPITGMLEKSDLGDDNL